MKLVISMLSVVLLAVIPPLQEKYILLKSIPAKDVDYFSVDHFNNLYLVNGNELIKYDKDAKQLYSFSNPILG